MATKQKREKSDAQMIVKEKWNADANIANANNQTNQRQLNNKGN
jgi:hypothetical protein